MTHPQKFQIQELLNDHCGRYDSQAKAADALKSVSEATVINIRKNKWEDISDEMWRKVGKQLGWKVNQTWALAQTRDYKTLMAFFGEAQEFNNVYGIIGNEGGGKTTAATTYKNTHRNVYHIVCAEYFNPQIFLAKILTAMGKENTGFRVAHMVEAIIGTIMKQENPLIILDEYDKLKEPVFLFFISLYNLLEDKCGIVLLGTDYLEKRVEQGVNRNKKGYKEIYSRMGKKFIELDGASHKDVKAICELNGISEDVEVNEIYNSCLTDLRAVKSKVHKKHRLAERSKNVLTTA